MSTLDTTRPVTGQGMDRVDGPAKVCGMATFAAEFRPAGLAHAVLITSTVAKGQIAAMQTRTAEGMRGVLAVITPFSAARLPQGGRGAVNPPAGRVLSLLQDTQVAYNNQPIGMVVAETLEQAADAARAVTVRYAGTDTPTVNFDAAKPKAYAPKKANQNETDSTRGDVSSGIGEAASVLRATYSTPIEHHNPMEPHATVAVWNADKLTVYDATQYVTGVRQTLSKVLGISPDDLTVISPYVGGGFGCKGSMWSHVALAAMAAKQVGRPVKLVLERPQMFGMVGNRPPTEQNLTLGAKADGTLTAVQHEVFAETSTLEDWTEPSAVVTRMLYACPNLQTSHRLTKLDIGTPTFMRAPGEASGSFALECSMDELAHALKLDPIELRLRNYAAQDPEKNKPFSSKALRECYADGAQRFGWSRRRAETGALRNGNWQIGLGMASATYPANRSQAEASVRLMPDGSAVVQSGSQDLGTGTYTVMTQVAADAIGIAPDKVRFELGDSRMPKAPVSGGSQSAASVAPAVQAAGLAARSKLIEMATKDPQSPLHGRAPEAVTIERGVLRWRDNANASNRSETIQTLMARAGGQPVTVQAGAKPGDEKQAYSMHSFGAVFAEVWVDRTLGIVRVPRVVGSYGVGNLLNEKLARSQLMGGVVWGVGMALFEESNRDLRNGRIVNGNLADYHVPVNADIGAIEIAFMPEIDPHINALGIKGIGEIGITGVAAAVSNAVFNATGKRVRDLPITLDKLI